MRARTVLSPLDQATQAKGLRQRAFDLARSAAVGPFPGPSREELVALANG